MTRQSTQGLATHQKRPTRLESPELTVPRKRARLLVIRSDSEHSEDDDTGMQVDDPQPEPPRPTTPERSPELPQMATRAATSAPPSPSSDRLLLPRPVIVPLMDKPILRYCKEQLERFWPDIPKLRDMPPGWPEGKNGQLAWVALEPPEGQEEEENMAMDCN